MKNYKINDCVYLLISTEHVNEDRRVFKKKYPLLINSDLIYGILINIRTSISNSDKFCSVQYRCNISNAIKVINEIPMTCIIGENLDEVLKFIMKGRSEYCKLTDNAGEIGILDFFPNSEERFGIRSDLIRHSRVVTDIQECIVNYNVKYNVVITNQNLLAQRYSRNLEKYVTTEVYENLTRDKLIKFCFSLENKTKISKEFCDLLNNEYINVVKFIK